MSEAAAPSEVGHPGQLQEHQVWGARPEGSSGASGGNGFMHPLKILRKFPKYQAQDLVQGLVLPPRSSSLEINLLHATRTSRYSKWNWVDLVHLGIFRLFLFFLTPGLLLLISMPWYPRKAFSKSGLSK